MRIGRSSSLEYMTKSSDLPLREVGPRQGRDSITREPVERPESGISRPVQAEQRARGVGPS